MQLPMAVKVTRVHCLCARLDWQVWKLLFQCSGTEMCDTRTDACHGCTCCVRVVFSATIQQVATGTVQIVVTGCAPSGSGSLHSLTIQWDPGRLLREQKSRATTRTAAIIVANEGSGQLLELRAKLIESQLLDRAAAQAQATATPIGARPLSLANAVQVSSAAPTAHWAPIPSATAALQLGVACKQQEVRRNKRKTHASHTKAVRGEILRLNKLGLDPAKIQAQLDLTAGEGAPHTCRIFTPW